MEKPDAIVARSLVDIISELMLVNDGAMAKLEGIIKNTTNRDLWVECHLTLRDLKKMNLGMLTSISKIEQMIDGD